MPHCLAQSLPQSCQVVRQLPSGNLLLNCVGIEVEGITVEQKRAILAAQVELDGLRKEAELLRAQVKDYASMADLFTKEREAREKESAALAAQLAIVNQRQVEADALIQQLVKATKRNRIEAALSNPILTLAFKLIVPVVGMFR